MKITVNLNVYELDNESDLIADRPDFAIKSHWNRDKMVDVIVGGHRYTLFARDLISAIERATGWKWG